MQLSTAGDVAGVHAAFRLRNLPVCVVHPLGIRYDKPQCIISLPGTGACRQAGNCPVKPQKDRKAEYTPCCLKRCGAYRKKIISDTPKRQPMGLKRGKSATYGAWRKIYTFSTPVCEPCGALEQNFSPYALHGLKGILKLPDYGLLKGKTESCRGTGNQKICQCPICMLPL